MLDKQTARANITLGLILGIVAVLIFFVTIIIGLIVVNV
jgi:hypothetical protein